MPLISTMSTSMMINAGSELNLNETTSKTTANTELLNVNGRKFNLDRNATKSIWSYNPEDYSLKTRIVSSSKNRVNNVNANTKTATIRARSKSAKYTKRPYRLYRSEINASNSKNNRNNQEINFNQNDENQLIFTKYFFNQVYNNKSIMNDDEACGGASISNNHSVSNDVNNNENKIDQNNNYRTNFMFYQHDEESKQEAKRQIAIDSFNYSLKKIYEMNSNSRSQNEFLARCSSREEKSQTKNAKQENRLQQIENMQNNPTNIDESQKEKTNQRPKSGWSSASYKNMLSCLVYNRYTTEAVEIEDEMISNQLNDTDTDSNKKFISSSTLKKLQPPELVKYASHIDALIPDVLAKLSDGLDPGLGGATTASDYLDEIATYEDGLESDRGDFEEEQDVEERDEAEIGDDDAELDPCKELESDDGPESDYEDEKVILETNFIRNLNKNNEENLVVKICNGINQSNQSNEDKKSTQTNKPRSGIKREKKFISSSLNVEPVETYNLKNTFETNQSILFNFEYEYEYTDVINDELRRVLDRYDGQSSADAFIKQHLSTIDQYSNLIRKALDESLEESSDKERDDEDEDDIRLREKERMKMHKEKDLIIERAKDSYLMLKRMLVKKKYVLATLKAEKEMAAKRNKAINRKNGGTKSRPVTASTNLSVVISEAKLNRPKTVNVIPIKPVCNEDPVSVDKKVILESTSKEEEAEKRQLEALKTNQTVETLENYYEPFQLASSALNQQNWPFELESETAISKQQSNIKSLKQIKSTGNNDIKSASSTSKGYTCKKIPVVVLKQKASQSQKLTTQQLSKQQSRLFMNTTANSNHRWSTYCSSSAKLKTQQQQPLKQQKSNIDLQEVNLRKCEVNKEEQMRRLNIIPGRTFRSQRTKSISIEHIPASRKKIDTQTQRMRIVMTAKSSENRLRTSEVRVLDLNQVDRTIITPLVQQQQQQETVLTRANTGKFRSSNIALAFQHQEEIFSLIRTKEKSSLSKLERSPHYLAITTPMACRTPTNAKLDDLTNFFYSSNNYSICSSACSNNDKRPKTSKV